MEQDKVVAGDQTDDEEESTEEEVEQTSKKRVANRIKGLASNGKVGNFRKKTLIT